MKVAVIHDWLTGMRGGERVLEEIFKIFPEADMYTMVYKKGSVSTLIENRKIIPSFINRLPFAHKYYKQYNPLFPFAVEQWDLGEYDLVISSSTSAAKGVITGPDTIHISYIHSPVRYYWDQYHEYFREWPGISHPILGFVGTFFRMWDVTNTNRIDYLIANSNFIARRIKKYYRREATVIYPCVHVDRFLPIKQDGSDYYLIVSALVPYKRVDVAIKAFNLSGKKLKVIGKGDELEKLKSIAKDNIEFLGRVSDADVDECYKRAKGFIINSVEDFGIAPIEAMAAGVPVIAYGKGGVLETVVANETGIFYNEQTPESLNQAIDMFETMKWDTKKIKEHSKKFSNEEFAKNFKSFVADKLKQEKNILL